MIIRRRYGRVPFSFPRFIPAYSHSRRREYENAKSIAIISASELVTTIDSLPSRNEHIEKVASSILSLMQATQSAEAANMIPLLGIRMKISELDLPRTERLDDSWEVLAALRSQETAYRCKDYFERRLREEHDVGSKRDPSLTHPEKLINLACREKMCEWCYRVCDCGQFPCCREMVAVAFSYLDRFLNRRFCDRAQFKLAAVTSFYVATKILSSAQISIGSLVELGRGEFDWCDILEMEKSLLETLEWRLHPPTPQGFIRQLLMIFPLTVTPTLLETIYQRAVFFSELCVYDHRFIGKDRYLVAVASLLNAVEVLEGTVEGSEKESLRAVGASMGIDLNRKALEWAQARLWYLYSCSAQVPDFNILPLAFSERHILRIRSQRARTCTGHSPISVVHE